MPPTPKETPRQSPSPPPSPSVSFTTPQPPPKDPTPPPPPQPQYESKKYANSSVQCDPEPKPEPKIIIKVPEVKPQPKPVKQKSIEVSSETDLTDSTEYTSDELSTTLNTEPSANSDSYFSDGAWLMSKSEGQIVQVDQNGKKLKTFAYSAGTLSRFYIFFYV